MEESVHHFKIAPPPSLYQVSVDHPLNEYALLFRLHAPVARIDAESSDAALLPITTQRKVWK